MNWDRVKELLVTEPPQKEMCVSFEACAQDQSQKFLCFPHGSTRKCETGDLLYWCLVGLGLHTELVLTE